VNAMAATHFSQSFIILLLLIRTECHYPVYINGFFDSSGFSAVSVTRVVETMGFRGMATCPLQQAKPWVLVQPAQATTWLDSENTRNAGMDIYVGNLPYSTTDDDLRGLFAAHGEVASARVVIDRMTGRSKGFGFVEMADRAQAQQAIDALNGYDIEGRKLRVNESQPKPREERGGGGGFRGRDRGGDRGGSRW